jgi:hypothetical protein
MPELPARSVAVAWGVQPAYLALAEHGRKLEDAARHLAMRRRVPIAVLDMGVGPGTYYFRIPTQPHTDTLLLAVWQERAGAGQRLSLTTNGVNSTWFGGVDGWIWQTIPVTPTDTAGTWDITMVFEKQGEDFGSAVLGIGILSALPVQSVVVP